MELDKICIDDFRLLMHTKLKVRIKPEIEFEAEIIELTAFDNYTPLDRKPFSLICRTTQKNEYYQQGIFIVQHPVLGDLELFFTAKGPDNIGMTYEAVFA